MKLFLFIAGLCIVGTESISLGEARNEFNVADQNCKTWVRQGGVTCESACVLRQLNFFDADGNYQPAIFGKFIPDSAPRDTATKFKTNCVDNKLDKNQCGYADVVYKCVVNISLGRAFS